MRFIGRLLIGIALLVGSVQAQSIRWGQIRTSETGVFNVKTSPFNAKGNGTIDDTAAIQAAITAASTSGGVVYFPPGTYKFSRLTIVKPKVYLKGAGIQATILQTTVTTGSAIKWDSTGNLVNLEGGGADGFTLLGAVPSTVPIGSEIGIDINGIAASNWTGMTFEHLQLGFLAFGMRSTCTVDATFADISVTAVKKDTGIGFEFINGHERWIQRVLTYNTSGNEGLAGVRIGAGSIGDYFDGVSTLAAKHGVLINPAAGEGLGTYANYVSWGSFDNLLVDGMTVCGISVAPAATQDVNLWIFNNTWASTITGSGICTSGAGTIHEMQWNNGRIRGAQNSGFKLENGSNFAIRGVDIRANGATSGHGIYAKDIVGLDIQSNNIGHPAGDGQLYGIYLTGTTDGVNITGNSIRGNATGSIFDDTTLGDKWIDANQGVDQSGQIVASAASIIINDKPLVVLTGTATVNTLNAAPYWSNRRIYIQATNANPAQPTITSGGTAGATFDRPLTLKQNEIATCVYSTTSFTWHCEGPNNPLIMVSLAAQNAAIASGSLYASAPAGTYEATAYLHTTTASTGSCTSNVTIGYTFNGGAKTVNVITAHNHQVDEAASTSTPATFAVDNATHITRAVDLTAGGGNCTNAVYSIRIVLKKVI